MEEATDGESCCIDWAALNNADDAVDVVDTEESPSSTDLTGDASSCVAAALAKVPARRLRKNDEGEADEPRRIGGEESLHVGTEHVMICLALYDSVRKLLLTGIVGKRMSQTMQLLDKRLGPKMHTHCFDRLSKWCEINSYHGVGLGFVGI